jgi:cell division cycle 14
MDQCNEQVGYVPASRIRHKDLLNAQQIIQSKLMFMVVKCRPKKNEKSAASDKVNRHFFSIDSTLRYEPFFLDFGPLNLGCLYRFCMLLNHKLHDEKLKDTEIYFFTAHNPQSIANASVLIGAYQVLYLMRSPAEAFATVVKIARKAERFRDASMGFCRYKCTVEHCIYATYRAKLDDFLNFDTFNVHKYEYFERVEFGDFNIIVPGKFIAFAGPSSTNIDVDGYPALTPAYYINIWKKMNVSTIIRLNKKCYDKRSFTKHGFEHHDLYFTDGTTPSRSIVKRFLGICEKAKGVLAIHCKAGLGRTGSLIGCYIMKHYRWTAQEFIAWVRICRPGSIIGPQQQFLRNQQKHMWKEGDLWRKARGLILKDNPYPYGSKVASRLNSTRNEKVRKSNLLNEEPTIPGSPFRTDPGQDQGGILREKKRLSPRQKGFPSPTLISIGNNVNNQSPQQEDIETRIISSSRPPPDLLSRSPEKQNFKHDPRRESPRNPANAAPIRQSKKTAKSTAFPFLERKSDISDFDLTPSANAQAPPRPLISTSTRM